MVMGLSRYAGYLIVCHPGCRSGLYRGWFSLVSSLFLTNFVYFYVFHCLRTLLLQEGVSQRYVTDLVFGMLAGTLAMFKEEFCSLSNAKLI